MSDGADDVKTSAAQAAQALVEVLWRETSESYDLEPLTALAAAQKMANAVLAGAIGEHVKVLGEPFSPQQTRKRM